MIRWRNQGYDLRSTNRRYATKFRDSGLGWALQFAVLFIVAFLVAVMIL